VENNKSKLDHVLEGYRPIPSKKVYYPRNLNLSEDFVNSFHREYDRLVGEGINPKSLVERFGKALRFHVTEERRYKKLEEGKDCPPGYFWCNKDEKCKKKDKDEHDAEMKAANDQTAQVAGYMGESDTVEKKKKSTADRKKSEEKLQKSIGNRDKKGRADESDWSARKDAWARAKRNQDHNRHDWEGDEEDRVDEGKKKKKKSRKKGGTYGMGDSHADSDGGDD